MISDPTAPNTSKSGGLIPLVVAGMLAMCSVALFGRTIGLIGMIPIVGIAMCFFVAASWNFVGAKLTSLTFNQFLFILFALFLFQDIIVLNCERFGIGALGALFKKSDEGALLGMAGVIALRRLLKGEAITFHPLLYFPIAMTMWSIICQLVNDVSLKIALLDNLLMVKGFFVLFIALNVDYTRRTLKTFLFAMFWMLIFTVFVEGIQIASPGVGKSIFGVEPQLRGGSVRPTGPFDHPGTLGTFLGFSIGLTFATYYVSRSLKAIALYAAGFIALVLSLTIRQFVGHVMGIVAFLTIFDRSLLTKFAIIAMLGAPLVWPIAQKNIENVQKNDGGYLGETVRNQAYINMWVILDESPIFGVGPGKYGGFVSIVNHSEVYERLCFDWINQELYSLDAYWPHIFGEYGYPGGIMYFIFIGGIIVCCLRRSGPKNPPCIRIYAIAGLCSTAMGLFDSVFSTFYENTFVGLLMYSQLGLMLGYAHHRETQRTRTHENIQTIKCANAH